MSICICVRVWVFSKGGEIKNLKTILSIIINDLTRYPVVWMSITQMITVQMRAMTSHEMKKISNLWKKWESSGSHILASGVSKIANTNTVNWVSNPYLYRYRYTLTWLTVPTDSLISTFLVLITESTSVSVVRIAGPQCNQLWVTIVNALWNWYQMYPNWSTTKPAHRVIKARPAFWMDCMKPKIK